jgi:4-hydroxy-2-oxoheptanedioate aldolase
MIENPFKEALSARRVEIGLWASLADPYAIEIVAGAGFDWLLIDAEHGPNDLRSVLAQLQVVAAYTTHPVVRLPIGDAVLIKQFLDIGAQSLLIPMVESSEHARAIVAATRYAPQGMRGVASGRASRWASVPDYFSRASQLVCLLLQVETAKGLQNLEEILAVEGVDGVFIGPSDLAASLGHLGNPGHPDVVATIQDAIRRIVGSGKAAGILTTDNELARAYIERGVTFCAVGIDTLILAQGVRTLARKFMKDLPAAPVVKPGGTY